MLELEKQPPRSYHTHAMSVDSNVPLISNVFVTAFLSTNERKTSFSSLSQNKPYLDWL